MSISNMEELKGMMLASEAVAVTLREMRRYARPGMSTLELDQYGRKVLETYGAKSAPALTYGFPGWTCISVNEEFAHGIPGAKKILQEGDLINIDVSAELDGFWSDNGGSFVLGEDVNGHQALVDSSRSILRKAIAHIKGGILIRDIGYLIETEAKRAGYSVIRNLTGHGIGRSLHEAPHEIANFRDRRNHTRFRRDGVVAVETFIATRSTLADTGPDGWTLTGNRGGLVVQHEHTILITDREPMILTDSNQIW